MSHLCSSARCKLLSLLHETSHKWITKVVCFLTSSCYSKHHKCKRVQKKIKIQEQKINVIYSHYMITVDYYSDLCIRLIAGFAK